MSDMQSNDVQDLIDLLEVARLVVSTLEMDQVLEAILKSAMKLTETSAGSIALYKKDTNELELHAHRGLSQDFIGNTVWKVRPGGLTDRILKSNKPTVITNTTNKKFFTNPLALKEGIKSIVCVPLAFKNDIIGILYVDDFTPRKFDKSQLNLLSILSSFAAMSIDHARLHENTRRMAFTDGLTGLYNHRHFQEQLEKEISRASRHRDTFSLLMVDIDDFKCINDKFGHTFGDKVLQKLADILKASIRDSDTPARYGGEEFAIILPKVTSGQSFTMAQRIRKQVKIKSASLMRDKAPLTISIGVAEYPKDAKRRLDLIKSADKALYKAKGLGKDQVVQFRTWKELKLIDLIKILLVFILIIRLLQLKWNLGGVMLIGATALGLLMGLSPIDIIKTAFHASIEKTAVSLIIALALIMVLENILRKTETLKKLVESFKGLIGDQRAVMALMPAIIGILPSAGGAFFSAPMVEASADGSHIKPERLSFINYWFRHIWEYVSPLYPGFIMMAAITNVPMSRLFLHQVAFPATVLATGAIYAFKDIKTGKTAASRKSKKADMLNAAVSFSPILTVMLLVMVVKVDIAIAMVIVVSGLFVYFRYSPAKIWLTLKESLSYKTLLLVMGVEIFKGVMTKSGAVEHLPQFFQQAGVPVLVIIFLLPFLVGLITGLTLAFVAVTFPMILPLIGGAHPDLPMLAFAFASGFAGIMFSPVHLCLVLTKDYFKSDLWPIFRIMLLPEGLVLAVALAQVFIL